MKQPFVEESFDFSDEEFESSEFDDSGSDKKSHDGANNRIEIRESSDCDNTNDSSSTGIEIDFSSESCVLGEEDLIEDELLDDISILCEDYGNLKGMESEKLHDSEWRYTIISRAFNNASYKSLGTHAHFLL